jgi:hypothetical protein
VPAALCEYADVEVIRLSSSSVPTRLQDFCDAVVSAFYHAYQSVGQVILSIDFDIEPIVTGCPAVVKDLPRAPHLAKPRSGWEFQYRYGCCLSLSLSLSLSSLCARPIAATASSHCAVRVAVCVERRVSATSSDRSVSAAYGATPSSVSTE